MLPHRAVVLSCDEIQEAGGGPEMENGKGECRRRREKPITRHLRGAAGHGDGRVNTR